MITSFTYGSWAQFGVKFDIADWCEGGAYFVIYGV